MSSRDFVLGQSSSLRQASAPFWYHSSQCFQEYPWREDRRICTIRSNQLLVLTGADVKAEVVIAVAGLQGSAPSDPTVVTKRATPDVDGG